MELRFKLDNDISKVVKRIVELTEKFSFDFLPLLVICSEKKTDILRINTLPENKKILLEIFSRMGTFIAKEIDDAFGFILVCQPVLTSKKIKIIVKSIDGLSRVLFINNVNPMHNTDSGWLDKKTNKDFFKQPDINNLEDLWRTYRLNLIVKKINL